MGRPDPCGKACRDLRQLDRNPTQRLPPRKQMDTSPPLGLQPAPDSRGLFAQAVAYGGFRSDLVSD